MAFTIWTETVLKQFRRFVRSEAGNMAMLAGLSSLPVIAAAGMAIDYARISRVHDEMQVITDGATLAAAGARNLTGTTTQKLSQRSAIATHFLNQGLAQLSDVDVVGAPVVVAAGASVKISVNARVKASFMNVLEGFKSGAEVGGEADADEDGAVGRSYGIAVSSEASWKTGKSYICLLALNPSEAAALHVKGTADIDAKDCGVWVNSRSNSGLYQNGNATLTAKRICVNGYYYGSNYYPDKPQSGDDDCPVFKDPLAADFSTDYAATFSKATVRSNKKLDFDASGEHTLSPGLYKGGIVVKNNRIVNLQPGIYFIQDGEFNIQAGGIVNALDGVTIVLTGNSSTRINVQAGGSLDIKAPATGSFKGLAIAQHPSSLPSASKENSIIGGGTVELTGMVYFPKQKLNITGNGWISQHAKLFAIVADRIYVEGNGQLNIGQAADFDSAGLPALPSTGTEQTVVKLH
jgi:hypothetical protein